jgi:hypothetical protein
LFLAPTCLALDIWVTHLVNQGLKIKLEILRDSPPPSQLTDVCFRVSQTALCNCLLLHYV